MKFWEDTSLSTYELYEELKRNKDWGRLAELIPVILSQYPKLTPYVIKKIDSSFGRHIVYLIRTTKGLKIGYSVNTIEVRFSESRYKGSEDFEILETLRQQEFQALGAVQFEDTIKKLCTDYKIETDMVMPGKGEMYDIKYINEILQIYDENIDRFKSIIGIKSPN